MIDDWIDGYHLLFFFALFDWLLYSCLSPSIIHHGGVKKGVYYVQCGGGRDAKTSFVVHDDGRLILYIIYSIFLILTCLCYYCSVGKPLGRKDRHDCCSFDWPALLVEFEWRRPEGCKLIGAPETARRPQIDISTKKNISISGVETGNAVGWLVNEATSALQTTQHHDNDGTVAIIWLDPFYHRQWTDDDIYSSTLIFVFLGGIERR